jgi:hypothetical protein
VRSPSVDQLLSSLAKCCDRWEKLSITSKSISRLGWEVVRPHLSGLHAPRLKALEISHMWDDESAVMHNSTFSIDAPALEYLHQGCIFWLPAEPFGAHLSQAVFARAFPRLSGTDYMSMYHLAQLARSAPRLVCLTLWCSLMGPEIMPSGAMEIRFPALRSLRLHLYDFDVRASIIAPELECLVLTGSNRHAELHSFLTSVVHRPPEKRFPRVRHLHLHEFADNQPGLGRLCAQAFGSVQTLHIGDMRSRTILADLGVPLADGALPWPRLRRLAAKWATVGPLLAFAKARVDTPLEVLEAHYKYLKSVPERNDMAALERLVQLAPLPSCIASPNLTHFFDIRCDDCNWGETRPSSGAFPATWVADGNDDEDADALSDDEDGSDDTPADESEDE